MPASRVYLVEDIHPFTPKPEAIQQLRESVARGGLKYPVEVDGRLSVCNVRNENNREYPLRVWQKQLAEDSPLRKLISLRRSVGLLEHPTDGNVSLGSPISHVLLDVRMEGNEIWGKLGFINTAEGNKMLALMEAGYNPLVSSRGYGSVVCRPDGINEVQDDYMCEGWDVVWNPSFKSAELDGKSFRERISSKVTEDASPEGLFSTLNRYINEGRLKGSVKLEGGVVFVNPENLLTENVPAKNLTESVTPVAKTANTKLNMDKFNQIRESLTPLAVSDPSKMDPRALVESLARCGDLHRQVAVVQATDANLSWDASLAHKDIELQEKRISEAMDAPNRKVVQLTEQHTKTLRVLKTVLETAQKYKTSAGKGLKECADKAKKLKETIEKGHGWIKRCKLAEDKLALAEQKYRYAAQCIEEAKNRYFQDVSELGRRVIQLEFKISDADILKELNEATTPKALIAIRERLEGKFEPKNTKDDEKAPGEPKVGKEKDKLADKKDSKEEDGKKHESTEAQKLAGLAPVEPAGKVTESLDGKVSDANPRGLRKLEESVLISGPRQFSITEQTECVGRLSRASAAAQK